MEMNSSYLRQSINPNYYNPNKKDYSWGKIEVEEFQKLRARRSQNETFKKMRRVKILNERRNAQQTIVQLKRLDSLQ
jgi:hypothetical protein